ncbi:hypothetical protein HH212_26395 (plasmid) [Massilia forsythiae]|uniref:Uncharacterized protein n=1 Tax=Massilia forsythiae TaxID=2728020 RepID=A0A7Z2W2N7_9BURK|nr:hypothetical protein [Massilia forsythiae]QJE03645.1 hypothetical protein HH212_26395 [Massilia forsythiae]
MVKTSFFYKQFVGFAALASKRDWAIVSSMVVGILGLSKALLTWAHVDSNTVRSMTLCGLAGMLPSILICLPVYGVVDDLSRDALHSFLKSLKFTRYFDRNGIRFYTQNTSAWMRWDSNRVAVSLLPNGQLRVVMPFYCYRVLKRWS